MRPLVLGAGGRPLPPLETQVPTWQQIVRLAAAFEDPSLSILVPYRKEDSDADEGKGGGGRKKKTKQQLQAAARDRDVWLGSVRPDDFLGEVFKEFRSSDLGQQEDAMEFATFLFNKLHAEVIALQEECRPDGGEGQSQESAVEGSEGTDNGEAWLEIGEWRRVRVWPW